MKGVFKKETCQLLAVLFVVLNLKSIISAVIWVIIAYSLFTGKLTGLSRVLVTINYVFCVIGAFIAISVGSIGIFGTMATGNGRGIGITIVIAVIFVPILWFEFKTLRSCRTYLGN